MHRRKFLKNSTALAGVFPFASVDPFNILNAVPPGDEDIVRIKTGNFTCTLFRDFMFEYQAKDFFINASQEELSASLHKYHISPGIIPSPFIAVLVQQDDRTILIDTGVGYSEKPVNVRGSQVFFKGNLLRLLEKEKVFKEDITDVIITHFHPDHIGGIFSDEETLNFPRAQFHMHEDEWNYWHSGASVNQPGQFKYFIEKNISKLKDYNLQLFRGDWVELLPGITAVKADGHTPGQIAVIIHSAREHLLYISDAFLHPLHIERLDWKTNYDLDQEQAGKTRVKLLELAYKDSMLVSAFHFDFPSLGRIDMFNNNWVWKYSEK